MIAFLAAHPATNVDLQEGSSRRVAQQVANGTADVGVIAESAKLSKLEHIPLATDELVLVAAPGNPLAELGRVTLAQGLVDPFVGLSEGRSEEQHYAGAARPVGPRLNYRVMLPTVDAVCEAVAAGVGVSVLPESAVQPRTSRHDIRLVRLDDAWARRELLLCAPSFDELPDAVGALVGFLTGSDP